MSVRSHVQTDFRTEFSIIEGTYKNIRVSEHCRPSRQPLFGKELSQVKVSFVSCKDKDGLCEWIVFNSAKELYFYPFDGVGEAPDLKHPLDKRVYKSPTIPVCHDFNQMTRSPTRLDLIVGFSTGPLQHLLPLDRQAVSSFNEDGSIDSTRVTCVKWVPGSEHTFVSSHRSGNLYVWSCEHANRATGPQNYTVHAEIQDAIVYTVKPRNKSSILFCWSVGHGPINAFAFSPDSVHIAIASQDGFLRVYDFHKQVLYGRMRSYFGGLLCICWSPDGKYTVTGGEDDLITVWSFEHRKVIARGEGHKSYVSSVAFDPYTTILPDTEGSSSTNIDDPPGLSSSPTLQTQSATSLGRSLTELGNTERDVAAYRLGSVGQDSQLCLWDLSGDALKLRRPFARTRSRVSRHTRHQPQPIPECSTRDDKPLPVKQNGPSKNEVETPSQESKQSTQTKESDISSNLVVDHYVADTHPSQPENKQQSSLNSEENLELGNKDSTPSISSESSDKNTGKKDGKKKKVKITQKQDNSTNDSKKGSKVKQNSIRDPMRKVLHFVSTIGTTARAPYGDRRQVQTFETCNNDDIAPTMDEINLIEPLIAKKISQERLTCLLFREDCIVTATQEGFVNTWARPDTQLPQELAEDQSPKEQPSTAPSNPGINSPKPGSGPDHSVAIKSTAI